SYRAPQYMRPEYTYQTRYYPSSPERIAVPKRFCYNCGAVIIPGAKFCSSCGRQLSLDDEI
ncbi:MAG: zinc-ribbon domain-containing protein, partial [Promethearchaeota archaeon]